MPAPFGISTTAPHFAPFGPTGRHSTSRELPVKGFRRRTNEKEVPVGERDRRPVPRGAGRPASTPATFGRGAERLDLVRRQDGAAQAPVRCSIESDDLEVPRSTGDI